MSSIDPEAVEHIPPEAASTYAKLAGAYGGAYYRSVAETVAPRLDPNGRLLDVGTGPGFLPLSIADRTEAIRIDAFDFTRELVRYGRERAVERGVGDRLSFFVADCYAIPARRGTYSALTCTGVLHALAEPSRALTECHRVLRPGGEAWVFDPAVIDVPDEPDVDLTAHERDVFESYGVRVADDEPPISVAEAERIVDRTPFDPVEIETGPHGDVRFRLVRRD